MQTTTAATCRFALAALLVSLSVGVAGHAADATGSAFAPPLGRLARWTFDGPGFAADTGLAPLEARGLQTAPSLDGLALSFGRSNQVSALLYPGLETSGRRSVSYPVGSIRLLYRPAWSSRQLGADPQYSWGRGPTVWARLFTLVERAGGQTNPVLSLSIDPDGTNLVLEARGTDGTFRTNFSTRIAWLRPQPALFPDFPWPWHEVAVAWSPTNTLVAVDGLQTADWSNKRINGPGVGPLIGPASNLALTVGTDANGDGPVNGLLDEIETFDRTFGPQDLYAFQGTALLSAAVAASPPAVTLQWRATSAEPVAVQRRLWGQTNWVTLTNGLVGFSFVDRDPQLSLGATYEYEVGRRVAVVSIQGRPVEHRGRAILLVDETVARPLANELEQLRSDLVGDGWTVVRHEVPRHQDNAWAQNAVNPRYIADVRRIKSLIQASYAAAPTESHAALLIGHVTIPYSGVAYEDGHFDNNGSWPADSYYGDMDGEWSDTVANTGANITNPMRRNLPGDGKFDPHVFANYIRTPSGHHGVEVAVGRIDFVRMPAFAPVSEVELLRRYLRKDHAYRHAQVRYEPTVYGAAFFGSALHPVGRSVNLNALWTGTRLRSLAALVHGDGFQAPRPVLWAMQGGYGGGDTLHNSRSMAAAMNVMVVHTPTLATNRDEPQVAFYLLKGSYFGDWNGYRNDLMRGILATPRHGLVSCWTMEKVWRFETLGAGDTLGSGLVRTAQDDASTRTTYLLGDPTLRAQVTAPPVDVTGRRRGTRVELQWEPSPDASQGYFIYRSVDGLDGPHTRLTDAPLSGAGFTDTQPPRGKKLYQVRAAQLLVTGTGSFTNLSQAAFVAVD